MIYLFYGEEKYELYKELEKIKKGFEKLEVGVNYFNITKDNITELESLYDSVSFFGGNKLVVIKDTGMKFDTKKLVTDSDKDDVYVIIEDSVDKRLTSYKDLSKAAEIKEFKYLNENEMANYIITTLKKYDIEMSKQVADYMVSVCGIDKANNINEMQKLSILIKKNEKVSIQDIDKICSKTLNSKVFDMLDSAVLKKHEKAINMLDELIKQKEPAIKIAIMLYKQIKQMYMIKLLNSKTDANSVLKLHPFVFSKLKKSAESYTENDLKQLIFLFDKYDEKTKIGEMDFEIGLKEIICLM
ncbi:MAG: DNA polymerase III subunit delta [Clostridia bacterium]|nr:DNA polymerase III subunit delta [Clostridia bacterium]